MLSPITSKVSLSFVFHYVYLDNLSNILNFRFQVLCKSGPEKSSGPLNLEIDVGGRIDLDIEDVYSAVAYRFEYVIYHSYAILGSRKSNAFYVEVLVQIASPQMKSCTYETLVCKYIYNIPVICHERLQL